MQVQRISAFSDGQVGGNPAGVVITDCFPETSVMQMLAAEVGYSETAFAAPADEQSGWRVRYFSPESEVPFCGHATIALGAALARQFGDNTFKLHLNESNITVDGANRGDLFTASLQSPPTHHKPLDERTISKSLALFDMTSSDLDLSIPPARIHAGADHFVFALNSRSKLSQMNYDLDIGRSFMRDEDIITIMLVVQSSETQFDVRNAFASGGVLEDPATGAAAAAFSGYLRDAKLSSAGDLLLVQGEDMGSRSIIQTEFTDKVGQSIRVTGAARLLNERKTT